MRLAGRPRRVAAVLTVLAAGGGIGVTAAASAAVTPGARTAPAAASTTLKLASTSGLPDQSVGFSGGGFRAREKVAVHWRSASGPQLVKLTASKNGTISGSFRVPLPRAGVAARVTVVALGATSKHQDKASFTQSCGDEWTATKGGNWSHAADWSRGSVPSATTNACMTLAGPKSYTVVLNQLTGSITVGSLRVGAAGGKTTQTLEMDASGSDQYLTLAHTSTIAAHGVFRLTSAAAATTSSTARARSSGSTFVNKGTMKVLTGSEFQVSQASFTQSGGSISNGGLVNIGNATVTKTGGASTGNAWQFTGGVLHDKAGTGSYTFYDSGTLSGTIPAGQTVTVFGNGTDTQLALSGNVTNDGTSVLTSGSYQGDGGSNSWLFPLSGTPTLYSFGTIRTLNGIGWTRYFNVDMLNEPREP